MTGSTELSSDFCLIPGLICLLIGDTILTSCCMTHNPKSDLKTIISKFVLSLKRNRVRCLSPSCPSDETRFARRSLENDGKHHGSSGSYNRIRRVSFDQVMVIQSQNRRSPFPLFFFTSCFVKENSFVESPTSVVKVYTCVTVLVCIDVPSNPFHQR